MTEPHGNTESQIGNKNASKGKENHTANIHLLMTGEQKGMIKAICGDKKVAPTCLEYLLVLVEFQIKSPEELKQILQNQRA